MSMKSLFITLEGGEGSGKSTLLFKLERELTKRGLQAVKTREPGGSSLGEQMRQWLLAAKSDVSISPFAELFLFLAARAQHLEEVIKPSLASGKIVICDRFNDSTIAYQGFARGLGMDLVERLCDVVCQGVMPEITFFLDVNPQEGLRRTRKAHKDNAVAGEVDRIESEQLAFHERVRAGLHKLAANYPERIFVVDANQSADAVYKQVLRKLDSLLLVRNS